ncbi:MAG: Uncharacterized protein G01um101418_75 [Parcubacteria group bacterium Gr01-1014_18]|nr:MAG: Uncharacterized protein Greene041636_75 [Parcubacteria group bacterium Greene0416_36]TSC81581.1 MAG: Uncharacterized protein G01um101418_75 [Parcubacteria group bacterium Gr01-1014_18]TSC99608.1 MAG: Uncharacterized protein Greene101420_12 [Parcubacteria group bacterium Greene1014_20]TSD07059.1 MAG: Uncharacterized protein Greene07142_371 [Parcubacteria group bacterium Greene0714_2]
MSEIALLGVTNFRNTKKKFGIKIDDRRRHMYLLGKTGMGKSTILENMIIQDIINGKGLALIDPHGELVEKVINYIPSNRINDVIYFNPSDIDHPIAFNVLEKVDPSRRHLIASGIIGVFKKIWADSWGPRLEYLLRNAILALLDYPESTLLGVVRMLSDKEYRKKVVAKIQDPVVKAFWTDEFAKYTDKFATEAISPIQNKVGQFLSVTLIRNSIGQIKSSFDMREAMDSSKILLMNLSKGKVGEDNSAMLGAMMITKITLAAMSRVDMAETDRKDFYLYVDEFQNFATESFADILSEARKYHLCLIMAHQYITQLDEKVRDAVFGNVGSLITMRVGAADAEFLEKEFEPIFMQQDLVNLAKWSFYIKLMIDGVASDPFSAHGLPPIPKEFITNNVEKIIRVSRERYAKPRQIVEDKIRRWAEAKDDESSSFSEGPVDPNAIIAKCWNCQKDTRVNFTPDGVRPTYCKDCLKLYRQGMIKPPTTPPPWAAVPMPPAPTPPPAPAVPVVATDVPSIASEPPVAPVLAPPKPPVLPSVPSRAVAPAIPPVKYPLAAKPVSSPVYPKLASAPIVPPRRPAVSPSPIATLVPKPQQAPPALPRLVTPSMLAPKLPMALKPIVPVPARPVFTPPPRSPIRAGSPVLVQTPAPISLKEALGTALKNKEAAISLPKIAEQPLPKSESIRPGQVIKF